MQESKLNSAFSIVFYDGDCGFCDRTVQFILKHEKKAYIKFSPLQSDFSKLFFLEEQLSAPDYSTFYFYSNNQLYQKSRAAFLLLPHLKWYLQPLHVFKLLPLYVRDAVYDYIAKRRKLITHSSCAIPTNRSERFL